MPVFVPQGRGVVVRECGVSFTVLMIRDGLGGVVTHGVGATDPVAVGLRHVCIGIVGMNSRGVLGKTFGSELLYLRTDG
jgi:hypothetical protein